MTDTLTGNFDENRIVQVLNNLISNAIKYSRGGTEVGLSCETKRVKCNEMAI